MQSPKGRRKIPDEINFFRNSRIFLGEASFWVAILFQDFLFLSRVCFSKSDKKSTIFDYLQGMNLKMALSSLAWQCVACALPHVITGVFSRRRGRITRVDVKNIIKICIQVLNLHAPDVTHIIKGLSEVKNKLGLTQSLYYSVVAELRHFQFIERNTQSETPPTCRVLAWNWLLSFVFWDSRPISATETQIRYCLKA